MKPFAIVTAAALVVLTCTGTWAQKKEAAAQSQLVGSWSVQTLVLDQNGKKSEPFGAKPLGSFLFLPNGHFSTQIVRTDRAKFASKSRDSGSADENKQAVAGTITSFGTYTVDKDNSVTLNIAGSSFPNWDGTSQKRVAAFKGDEMTWTNPTSSQGGGTAVLVLKRVK
jgi:hypothetical protein